VAVALAVVGRSSEVAVSEPRTEGLGIEGGGGGGYSGCGGRVFVGEVTWTTGMETAVMPAAGEDGRRRRGGEGKRGTGRRSAGEGEGGDEIIGGASR